MSKSDAVSLIIVVVVAVFSSVTAPLILSARSQRLQLSENMRVELIRKQEKEEDWARQDAVAQKAAQAAADLAAAQAATIARTDQVAAADRVRQDEIAAKADQAARSLAEAQAATITRTDEVARLSAIDAAQTRATLNRMEAVGLTTHALVNNDMTEARESELVAARALLTVLERIVEARQTGHTPDPKDLEAIGQARARIVALEAIIADRKTIQGEIADTAAAAQNPPRPGEPWHTPPAGKPQ